VLFLSFDVLLLSREYSTQEFARDDRYRNGHGPPTSQANGSVA